MRNLTNAVLIYYGACSYYVIMLDNSKLSWIEFYAMCNLNVENLNRLM